MKGINKDSQIKYKDKKPKGSKLFITIKYLLLVIVFAYISSWITWKPMSQMLSHNPSGEYCYYEIFDKSRQKTRKLEKHETVWESQGLPCSLTIEFYKTYGFLFLITFSILLLASFILSIFIKNILNKSKS